MCVDLGREMSDSFKPKAEKRTLFVPSVPNIVQRQMRRVMWRENEHGTLAEACCEGDFGVKNIGSNVCSTI